MNTLVKMLLSSHKSKLQANTPN